MLGSFYDFSSLCFSRSGGSERFFYRGVGMKKITAYFLCFLLVFFTPSAVFASSAGSVVVSGGSIASGGLSGGYSQASESAAVTITMALLYSLGITVNLSQTALDAGQSAYSFVRDKMAEWVGGSSAEQLSDDEYNELKSRFSVINGGSNVGPDGKIYLNGTALDMIRRFLNWLKGNNYINSGSGQTGLTGSINNVSTYMGTQIPVGDNLVQGYGSVLNVLDSPVYTLIYKGVNGNEVIYFVVARVQYYYRNYNLTTSRYYTGGTRVNSQTNNNYYYSFNPFSSSLDYIQSNVNGITSVDVSAEIGNTTEAKIITWISKAGDAIVPGQSGNGEGFNYEGDFDPNTLNNPDGNQTVINPPLVQEMANENPDADAQIGVAEYLEALRQILNQVTNPQAVPESVPAEDLPTLSPVQLPIPDDLPLTWPVELPSAPTATPDLPIENTPVVDPSQPADPEIAIPEMSVHLEDYFPFCLPFDVYKIMQKFNGSPVAPQVHLSFDAPTLNIHIPLDLDFSVFDSVAAVLRNGEAVLYVVGLAVVTRKTFLRG